MNMPCSGFSLGEGGPPAMYEYNITDVRIEPATQKPNDAVTVKATFTNTFAYAITALYLVSVGWLLSGQPMGGEVLANNLSTVLAANEVKEISFGWTIPADWLPGQDRWICVDKR